MIIELTENERQFMKEALTFSRSDYETRAERYLYGSEAVEGYRELYKQKINMFVSMQMKLNKQTRSK